MIPEASDNAGQKPEGLSLNNIAEVTNA